MIYPWKSLSVISTELYMFKQTQVLRLVGKRHTSMREESKTRYQALKQHQRS